MAGSESLQTSQEVIGKGAALAAVNTTTQEWVVTTKDSVGGVCGIEPAWAFKTALLT